MVAMVKKHGLKSMPVNTGLRGVPQIVVGLFGLKTQYTLPDPIKHSAGAAATLFVIALIAVLVELFAAWLTPFGASPLLAVAMPCWPICFSPMTL